MKTLVDCRFEYLNLLFGDNCPAYSADQFFRLATEHAAAYKFNTALCVSRHHTSFLRVTTITLSPIRRTNKKFFSVFCLLYSLLLPGRVSLKPRRHTEPANAAYHIAENKKGRRKITRLPSNSISCQF
jgi:hypothetical protein